jgi:16S rRNA (uracil1498-N3)-methyltransferase
MQIFGIQINNKIQAQLLPEDVKHCIQVLRHKIGDEIFGVDGMGSGYQLQIQDIKKGKVLLKILEVFPNWSEPTLRTHLVFSTLKNSDRMEWMLEKSVELGVTNWHPIICKRTEKLGFPVERMKKIAWAAIKQCKRSKLPNIDTLKTWKEFIQQYDSNQKGLLAHCEATEIIGLHPILAKEDCWLFVGPEGDFSAEEVEMARQKNIQEVSFGKIRMRSETAGVYFLSIRHFLTQT